MRVSVAPAGKARVVRCYQQRRGKSWGCYA